MDRVISAEFPVEDVSEAEIQTNFKSYRPYIESCVKTMDLLVFFKLFTTDQVKILYKKTKKDPIEAIREAFDIISDMKDTSYKFHHLLSALEEAEYPKIVNLLKGALIRVHDNHRKKLKTFAKDFYQRLSVSEVLPYLLTKQVLNNHDVEEVKTTEKTESRGSAVILLLSILPNRNRDWYKYFLWGLLKSKQKELSMLIDKDMTEKLEKAEEKGTVNYVGDPSLTTVSMKTFHEWKAIKELTLQQPKMHPKRLEATQPVNVCSGQPMDYSKSNRKDHVHSAEKQCQLSSSFECSPCRREDCKVVATHYCTECADYLCHYCERVHKKLKTTHSHHVTMIKAHENLSQKETNLLSCTCGERHADFYCRLHETLACLGCNTKDHSHCLLLSIEDLAPGHNAKTDMGTYDKRRNLLKKRLRKLEFERENDQMKLPLSIKSCKRNIISFASVINKLINDQTDTMLKDISEREEFQNMNISGCREVCRLLNLHLDSKMDILQNARRTKNDFNTFVIHFKVAKFLTDAENVIDMMETAEYENTIDYKINPYLVDMIRSNSIGEIFHRSPEHTDVKAVENNESDMNAVGHQLGNHDGDVELYDIKRLLSDSCDTDVSYLDPFLQYIQKTLRTTKEWELIDSD